MLWRLILANFLDLTNIMKYLKEELSKKIQKVKNNKQDLLKKLAKGDLEFVVVTLIHEKVLSYVDYLKLKKEYEGRNKNIDIVRITSPRVFGDWSENHLLEIIPELSKDDESKGEYDLIFKKNSKKIKIEVKAGRAIDKTLHNIPYHERVLVSTDKDGRFDMNCNQLKPTCFDVFIMIGVWSDKIRYWLMTSDDVKKHKDFSGGQHRGNKGYEGQMHIKTENIKDFEKYEITPNKVVDKLSRLI